jgi:hypothetical protein
MRKEERRPALHDNVPSALLRQKHMNGVVQIFEMCTLPNDRKNISAMQNSFLRVSAQKNRNI